MKQSWFVVSIGGERYGLAMDLVDEVVRAVRLVRVPQAPAALAGALVLRGQALAVIDVRSRLGARERPIQPSDFFVVGSIAGLRGAVVVDLVEGMTEVDVSAEPGDHLPRPKYAVGVANDARGRPVVLLDLSRILMSKEAQELSSAVAQVAEGLGNGP